jgi:hypothetical protein
MRRAARSAAAARCAAGLPWLAGGGRYLVRVVGIESGLDPLFLGQPGELIFVQPARRPAVLAPVAMERGIRLVFVEHPEFLGYVAFCFFIGSGHGNLRWAGQERPTIVLAAARPARGGGLAGGSRAGKWLAAGEEAGGPARSGGRPGWPGARRTRPS